MPYFLIIIGLALIIYVLKFNTKPIIQENLDINDNKEKDKETVYRFDEFFTIQQSILELKNEIEVLKEEISYINENYVALDLRINELELDNKKENDKIEVEDKQKNKKEEKNEEDIIISLNDKIKDMYDKGLSVEEISAALRIGKGEVLLRLGLNKQRKK